jgi:transposase
VDALGSLVRLVLLPGQRHDMVGVAPLIRDLRFDALLADKAFDADWLRAELNQRGAIAVIPPKSNRKQRIAYDKDMYRWRHLVEIYFAKIKEFRGIATRYDKTDTSYRANLNLVATIIAMR